MGWPQLQACTVPVTQPVFLSATMTTSQVALSLCRLWHDFALVLVQHPRTADTRAAAINASQTALSLCRL